MSLKHSTISNPKHSSTLNPKPWTEKTLRPKTLNQEPAPTDSLQVLVSEAPLQAAYGCGFQGYGHYLKFIHLLCLFMFLVGSHMRDSGGIRPLNPEPSTDTGQKPIGKNLGVSCYGCKNRPDRYTAILSMNQWFI